jgi:hypothetical protein
LLLILITVSTTTTITTMHSSADALLFLDVHRTEEKQKKEKPYLLPSFQAVVIVSFLVDERKRQG